jgi:hypothetical protein
MPVGFDAGGLCQCRGWLWATGLALASNLAPFIVEVQKRIAKRLEEVGGRQ